MLEIRFLYIISELTKYLKIFPTIFPCHQIVVIPCSYTLVRIYCSLNLSYSNIPPVVATQQ